METSSQRAWQASLAFILIIGMAAAAACVLALMWWKAPAASAQEAEEPTGDASFVVRCDYSHRNSDDPIVHPGRRGAAHSHDFFGNRSTKYNSTLESLRAGGTTCLDSGDKSAYWIPTAKWTDSSGTRTLKADRGLFYYRAGGKDDDTVELYPDGLKVIPNSHVTWKCSNGTVSSSPPGRCSSGKLVVRIVFPDCSNGNVDSADHRSHMAYAVTQSDGAMVCPSTHPKPVPALTMNVRFPIPTTSGRVTLSSGSSSTMHADFYNVWDQGALTGLIDRCIKAAPFTASNPKPSECKLITST